MITAKQVTTTEPIEQISAFLDGYNQLVADIGNEVTNIVAPQMLDELRYTPPAVKYPIQWTSEKQRKAFFATDGFGRGIPTRRTNKMQQAWRVIGKSKNGKFELVVSNPVAYTKWVVGTLDFRSSRQAIVPMQKFHQNTGWQPIQPTVTYWLDVAKDEFNIRYEKTLREFTQRKSVTRTSRKS